MGLKVTYTISTTFLYSCWVHTDLPVSSTSTLGLYGHCKLHNLCTVGLPQRFWLFKLGNARILLLVLFSSKIAHENDAISSNKSTTNQYGESYCDLGSVDFLPSSWGVIQLRLCSPTFTQQNSSTPLMLASLNNGSQISCRHKMNMLLKKDWETGEWEEVFYPIVSRYISDTHYWGMEFIIY